MMPRIFNDNLFDDFMNFSFSNEFERNWMQTDVKETEDSYELDINLPGFNKEEISAKLENGYLTINAATQYSNEDSGKKKGKYIRKERYSGQCSRSFYVGNGVTQDEISAKFENGTLKLSIPKKETKEVAQNKYIAIEG